LTKWRQGWSQVAVECSVNSCTCVHLYRSWYNVHLYSSLTVPSIVCATHLDKNTLWHRVPPPTSLVRRFLQVLYDTRTGPVSILNLTLFVCLSVCGCMIIGRAQKMPACDWLQYFHSACILKTGKS
jgi:hypothetical protein